MSVRVFTSSADTTITNRYIETTSTRATGSNFGLGVYLEMFGWQNRTSAPSTENGTALMKFSYTRPSDPTASSWRLQASDAANGGNTPAGFTLNCKLLQGTWTEGRGTDDLYTQPGFANWQYASPTTAWSTAGGDAYAGAGTTTQYFERGYEDIDIDVTSQMAYFTASTAETTPQFSLSFAAQNSVYNGLTKTIWSKQSKYWDRAPRLVAIVDDFAGSDERIATLGYRHSFCLRTFDQYGAPADHPSYPATALQYKIEHTATTTVSSVDIKRISQGVYTASILVTASAGGFNATSSSRVVWISGPYAWTSTSFQPQASAFSSSPTPDSRVNPFYIALVDGWAKTYRRDDIARFSISQFANNMPMSYYLTATTQLETQLPVPQCWWRLVNQSTGVVVMNFITASNGTRLSYSFDRSFFDLSCSWLQPGATYRVDFRVVQGGQTKIYTLPGAYFTVADDLGEQYEI